jgi:hypothetical protein
MKSPAPFPKSLSYLQPFVRSLAKLPPEERNEDVDASKLDSTLRKRLRGLDEMEATAALSKDREQLARWLKASAAPDHPAYGVLGYLSLPEIAQQLVRPPEPPLAGPKITFEPPNGWKMKVVPFRLDLKFGRVWASIAAINQLSMEIQLRNFEHWSVQSPLEATLETRPVRFGEVSGKKFTILETAPVREKSVRYLLVAPGGNVSVDVRSRNGAEFDESTLEMQLHTLAITPSA